MKLLKQTASMLLILIILSFVVFPAKADYTELEAANFLASRGIINDKSSNTDDYRL